MALNHYISPDVWGPYEINLGESADIKKEFPLYDNIEDMLERVYYGRPEKAEARIAKKIDDLISKTKIYLGPSDPLPPGKRLEFGPRGGRYYEAELEVYRHLWERVKERQMKKETILQAINTIEKHSLPSMPWYFKVEKDGIIVGQGDKVQTVLKANMNPKGIEINEY